MKKLIALLMSATMAFSLCACGGGGSSMDNVSQKGTLSDPYSINDKIEFTAYQVESYNALNNTRTIELPVTFSISDITVVDGLTFDTNTPGDSHWMVTFNVAATSKEMNDTIYVNFDYFDIYNVNNKGVAGSCGGYAHNFTLDGVRFDQLAMLPGFDADSGIILWNQDGGELAYITINYCAQDGEFHTIYIDVNK